MIQTKKNFRKGNYNDINKELSEVNWDEIVSNRPTDGEWVRFRDLLEGLIQRHVPVYDGGKNKKVTTISKQTINQIKARDTSWSEHRQCPSAENTKVTNKSAKE